MRGVLQGNLDLPGQPLMGFRDWSSPSHAAYDIGSDMHVVEAWEIARPWFVDPDAASFTQTSTHPGGWFQGEYDLVYRWDGATRIIDIKASVGKRR